MYKVGDICYLSENTPYAPAGTRVEIVAKHSWAQHAWRVKFKLQGKRAFENANFYENILISEEIYNSPLYQLMSEQN